MGVASNGAGAGAGAGGGRAARALRFLLLLVMALAAVEFLFGSILEASPIKTYLNIPLYNSTNRYKKAWYKARKYPTASSTEAEFETGLVKNSSSTTPREPTMLPLPQNTSKPLNVTTMSSVDSSTPILISKIMDGIKTEAKAMYQNLTRNESLPLCDKEPPDLGPITVDKTQIPLREVEKKFPEVSWGGMYSPPNCTARHKVAIIIPYRNRIQHLAQFLNHMHPFLMKQQLEYGIFVIEQYGDRPFNRAKLFNVGFVESNRLKVGGWQCFIFHDVDLLPLDLRNMYSCPRQPRHMSASLDKYNYKLLYEDLFGGVSALTYDQFTKVNGFSNKYWGWGGEDDDMAYRIKQVNYHIARYKMSIARYTMLRHEPASPNPKRYQILSQAGKNFKKDGLSNLSYELLQVVRHHLYTLITVDIEQRS